MATIYPVNPRIRAYGKARIDIAQRVKNPEDWEKLWVRPSNPFPFIWGESWKHCVEYKVDDFPAEVGFFIDVLGLEVNAFDPGYAMFTSPQGDFFLAVVPAPAGGNSTPPDALRLQFMVIDILTTTRELEKRGIVFDQPPQSIQPGSSHWISSFHTPHGIPVDLWGIVAAETSPSVKSDLHNRIGDDDDPLDGDEEEHLEGNELVEDDEGELIEDEDTDVDETGAHLDEDESSEDEEDEEKLIFDEGEDADEDEEDDEDLEFDDDDLEDDEDGLELDEDDEFEDDESTKDLMVNPPISNMIPSPSPPRSSKSRSHLVQDARQTVRQPEYINLDAV